MRLTCERKLSDSQNVLYRVIVTKRLRNNK